ncbi:MAG: hypothetical protein KatS3mg110_0578 [Pirellulaceae bacterium]|nr:MAG: hypothetical protein KatS3mg110_0578 [Pirellulaceae bacterium]
MFHSRQATQEGLRAIEALKELRELELGCPELRLAGLPHLAQLPHLEKLTAHATPLGLDGIEILSGHSQLKSGLAQRQRDGRQAFVCIEFPDTA